MCYSPSGGEESDTTGWLNNNLLGSGDVPDGLQIPTVLKVKSKVLSLEHMAHEIWSSRAPPVSFHCFPPSLP